MNLRKPLLVLTDLLLAAFAALQLVLAAAVLTRAWWLALVFALAAAFLTLGLVRRCRTNLLRGAFLALLAPLLVGLLGLEPFDPAHHVARLAVVAVMLDAWHQTRRTSASVTSPALPA